jgi:hypothetical protein
LNRENVKKKGREERMEIMNGVYRYSVGQLVAEAEKYRLYLCQHDTNRQCLFQIALTAEQNGSLDRAAYILRELTRLASEVEEGYARVRTDPKSLLNYQLGFPELVDSFVCFEQGGRRVNILAFRHVDNVSTMVPVVNIMEKDKLRVDIKTSAWILGKTLKLLTFAHSEGMAIARLGGNNILIEAKQHYVVLFDWSEVQTFPREVPAEIAQKEIIQTAKTIIIVLGGDPETGEIPDSDEEGHIQYAEHLKRLSRGGGSNAGTLHKEHYALIERLGWKGFHPFTTHKLDDKVV